MKNLKIFTQNIDQKSIEQIDSIMETKAFSNAKVRIMPDVHAGKGCVIGFTAVISEKRIIPNVVGVDIGCGVLTMKLHGDTDRLIKAIERVPAGRAINSTWDVDFEDIKNLRCFNVVDQDYAMRSLGTLGGGNHYIELGEANGDMYLSIHTGSRNLGKVVAEHYQGLATKDNSKELAKELIARLKAEGRHREISDALANMQRPVVEKELAEISGETFDDYMHDMIICANYAEVNRRAIAEKIVHLSGAEVVSSFDTRHNYIEFDKNLNSFVVRKGAIRALAGEMVAIPLNMRDGIIIGIGRGNSDWNFSAPHGAGRILSRGQARKVISMEDYQASMEGIASSSVCEETLDEAPMAYKPAQEIIDLVADTLELVAVVKPIYNFKATN